MQSGEFGMERSFITKPKKSGETMYVVAGLILVILGAGIGIGVGIGVAVGKDASDPSASAGGACPCVDTTHLFTGQIRPSGWGGGTCQAWDNGNAAGVTDFNDGACTGDGVPDWCEDQWCYVDPNNCNLPSFQSGIANVRAEGLQFSYKACNEAFTGNTYVGHCQCVGHTGAFDGTKRPVNFGATCGAWNKQDAFWAPPRSDPGCTSANPPDW